MLGDLVGGSVSLLRVYCQKLVDGLAEKPGVVIVGIMDCYFCQSPLTPFGSWRYCTQCLPVEATNYSVPFTSPCVVDNDGYGTLLAFALIFREDNLRLYGYYFRGSSVSYLARLDLPQSPALRFPDVGIELLELPPAVLLNKIKTWITFS